jgi:GT2 family glycosyltransferase
MVSLTEIRPRAEGKFLYVGDEKFFVRGATYGAFAPNSRGDQFPEPSEVALDFGLMRQAGINAVLTYTPPPLDLLDAAAELGLRVIVNIPWQTHECFLEDRASRKSIREQVRRTVAASATHPAILMYCVAKEIPPPIVRWQGRRRVERFLGELYDIAKSEAPETLASYTNFPTTEYLDLPFVDVVTFNVYLHDRRPFNSYLARLQNLAGELPIVLTEIGMCSFRHGRDGQAAFLDWQMEEAFAHGFAGAVVFGWTDPFFQDGRLIEEWGFGLVDAERRPKPSYDVVKRRFTTGVPFPPDRKWPRISVVVALYNAAETLEDCLSSLQKLRYPDYEVIVVNDGSTDESAAIIDRFPFRVITTENSGVSASRNQGWRAATGEIVAYIDSDARADPDWLSYLAAVFQDSDVAAVGGPNLIPPEDGWVAQCVYRSPGGPTQVMFDDELAEHVPGCNMAFRADALEAVQGFDPIFRHAGDDVDICWRILERDLRIGFSPSAVVWHHRRPSVGAYWRQQAGYGVAESLLEGKHPNKFNAWGHTFWGGRIYAPYPFFRLFGRPVIYQGVWGSAGFQSIYETGGADVLSFLPRSMEWHLGLLVLSLVSLLNPWVLVPVGLGVGYTVWYCASCALDADLDSLAIDRRWFPTLRARIMLAWLHFLEPLARDWGRIRGGLTPWRRVPEVGPSTAEGPGWWKRLNPFGRESRWTLPGGSELDRFAFLEGLTRDLSAAGVAVGWNADWQEWDLSVRRGALGEARLRMVVEYHGGPKRSARLSARIRAPGVIYWSLAILAASTLGFLATGHGLAGAACLALTAILWTASTFEMNRIDRLVRSASRALMERLRRREPAHPVPTEAE